MMAANYRHIGGRENRLGRHYSRFSGIWPTAFVADQSLARQKSRNGGSNRRSWVSLKRGDTAESDARKILARLVSAEPEAVDEGDTLLLGEEFNLTSLDRIAALFGDDFGRALAEAAPGSWVGPLRSTYG